MIAPPVPAKTELPDWFRKLTAIDIAQVSATDHGLTVKRCLPFLEAMTAGWIVPLAATVRLEVSDGGRTVEAGWEFDKVMVSPHHAYQIKGHPHAERPACKFHNYWTIETSPGWSCLFLPLANRPNPVFEIFAGLVDTDVYQAPVHFPFITTAGDGVHTLERGTPLVQVIPIPRGALAMRASIRAETPAEAARREKVVRSTQAGSGWYRTTVQKSR